MNERHDQDLLYYSQHTMRTPRVFSCIHRKGCHTQGESVKQGWFSKQMCGGIAFRFDPVVVSTPLQSVSPVLMQGSPEMRLVDCYAKTAHQVNGLWGQVLLYHSHSAYSDVQITSLSRQDGSPNEWVVGSSPALSQS